MHRKPGLRADVLSFLRWVTVDAEINFAHAETGLQLAKGPSFNPVGWLVEVLLYVHRNRRLIRDGEPRTATSTLTQLLSSVLILEQVWVFIALKLYNVKDPMSTFK